MGVLGFDSDCNGIAIATLTNKPAGSSGAEVVFGA
jgi:hypothetical protein